MDRGQAGARAGALVGAVGGLVFVVVNAGAASGPWPVVLRVAAVALFLLDTVLVLRAPALGSGAEPTTGQLRAYRWTVLAEVLAFPAGTFVLRSLLGLDGAALPWVAVVVGVHFVVFARIFPGAGFLLLGVVVSVLGAAGLAMVVAGVDQDPVRLVAGVMTGFTLLAAVLRGVLLGRAAAP